MSKYRNKQKGGKVVKVFKQGEPKFDYTSKCCGVPASKKPCSKGNGEPDDRGFFLSPLGTWNCTSCRRKCVVNRTVRKKVEVTDVQVGSQAQDQPLVESYAAA